MSPLEQLLKDAKRLSQILDLIEGACFRPLTVADQAAHDNNEGMTHEESLIEQILDFEQRIQDIKNLTNIK